MHTINNKDLYIFIFVFSSDNLFQNHLRAFNKLLNSNLTIAAAFAIVMHIYAFCIFAAQSNAISMYNDQ